MKKINVLIAEDHATVREGLKLLVNNQSDLEVIGEADNGRTAIQMAIELQPDVVVMDISMPDINGLQATELIKEKYPQIKILALTRYTDGGFLQQIIGAGASGYALKQSPSTALLQAIRTVAMGSKYLDPVLAGKMVTRIASKRTKPSGELPSELSEREREVLQFIARGYSNKEIAACLQISIKTVEVHKANAMKKLRMHSRIDIVRYALLQGWLRDP